MKTYDERMRSVQEKVQRKVTRRRWVAATAGMLCICILVGIAVPHFVDDGNDPSAKPATDISAYEDSEYYPVIKALMQYRENGKSSENLDHDFIYGGVTGLPMAPGEVPEADNINSSQNRGDSSVEITDNQVEGVLEADIIKRSQTHVFYFHDHQLDVYPIAGENTELLCSWKLVADADSYFTNAEMYLSEDATQITLLTSGRGNLSSSTEKKPFVKVISLDVTDPANIKELGSQYVTGSMITSRVVGDNLIVVSQYRVNTEVDFKSEYTYLPQYGTPGNMQSIAAENIVVPDELTNQYYTVVTLLDGEQMTVLDTGAFLSHTDNVYVSQDNIYVTRSYFKKTEAETGKRVALTEISCMSYGENTLTVKGSFCVEGQIKDQYSMDEYNGIFRVVTTTQETGRASNANLYCFEVGTWEQKALVERFAPDGETAESVRFDGNYAYVCTAKVIVLTDPVYFFDLTDLNNITVKDTGTISGYSSSLVQLEDGYLLGIGFGNGMTMKIEIYEETKDGVRSVCSYQRPVTFASEYKAYYIDRENNLFGIPTDEGYLLLSFDGRNLTVLAEAELNLRLNTTRGFVADAYLYVFNSDDCFVKKLG